MDLSGILDLFGYSVFAPKIEQLIEQCDAPYDRAKNLDRYDSVESRSLGVSLWFGQKEYFRKQIGEPKGTVRDEGSVEMVLYEAHFKPQELDGVKLPFRLSFPATPDTVLNAMGRKPFNTIKNILGEPVWSYYQDAIELMVIFEAPGQFARCFKFISMTCQERAKIDFLENLKSQKQHLLPERIPEIEALLKNSPSHAWHRRMKSGDANFTSAAIEAAEDVFKDFISSLCTATQKKNPKSIATGVAKATKALNKVARQHPQFIETMEREEIVAFFNQAVQLTGIQVDPSFDLTEEHRSW